MSYIEFIIWTILKYKFCYTTIHLQNFWSSQIKILYPLKTNSLLSYSPNPWQLPFLLWLYEFD